MTGKEKCELLRSIRRIIAEENNIEYLSSECNNQQDCAGTCHKCDAEIRFLEMELNRKVSAGEHISIAGLFDALSDEFIEKTSWRSGRPTAGIIPISDFDKDNNLPGDIPL